MDPQSRIPLVAFGGKPRRATPSGGVSRVIPPQDGPPNLGVAFARSIPGRFVTDFSPIYTAFLGRLIPSQ